MSLDSGAEVLSQPAPAHGRPGGRHKELQASMHGAAAPVKLPCCTLAAGMKSFKLTKTNELILLYRLQQQMMQAP